MNETERLQQPEQASEHGNQNKWILGLVGLNTILVVASCMLMGLLLANSYMLQMRIQSLQGQVGQTTGILPAQPSTLSR
jgi:hypothetical protein